MRTVNFRLFAGFTSFISNWCFSHFRSIGPEGTFASRTISRPPGARRPTSTAGGAIVVAIAPLALLTDDSGQDGDRDDAAADGDQHRRDEREAPEKPIVLAAIDADRLEHAPDAVIEMEAERDHREDVEEGHVPVA